MLKQRALLLCSAAAFAVLATPALAAAQPPTADTVDELVIVGGLEETQPSELYKQGHDLVIVSGETIKNNNYVDLGGALQMQVPGLYLAQQAGPFSYAYLSLQGSRAQDVLWTVDGIRVNNRLYSGTLPNDTIPSSMIERIEVLKGGESLFYGTQGVAGVINVVTRSFSDKFGGEVNLGGDTNDGVHADGYLRGGSGQHRFVVFANKDESDGYETFDIYQPSATARKRSYDVESGGLKYGFDFSEALKVSLNYIHTNADLDYPGARLTAFSQNQRDEDIIGAKIDYAPDSGVQFYLKAYHHDWDSHYTTINNVVGKPGQTVTTDDNLYWGYEDTGVNALAKYPVGGIDYLAGYDFQTYKAKDEVLIIEQVNEQVHGIFAQIATNKDMSDRYRLAAGVRYNKTGENNATVYNVSGRFDLTDSVFIEGNAGTSFTLPTAENLHAVDPFSTFGNPELKPEESQSINISLGGRMSGVEWLVTGFDRKVKDLITFSDDLSLIPASVQAHPDFASAGEAYINLGEVNFSGFDVSAATHIADNLTISGSYTHTKSEAQGANKQLDRIPVDLAKAQIAWNDPDSGWGASAAAIWTGEVFRSLTSPVERFNYGDYYVLDLALYAYLDQEKHHRITVRLQNAFDEDYATQVQRVLTDSGTPTRVLVRNRGVPQTFHVRYSYAFGG